jgi:hypothetical protein
MASKIRLLSLKRKDMEADFIGWIDVVDASLHLQLEEFGVVDWPFNFWNAKVKCTMKDKLEGMTSVDSKVYIIPYLSEDGGPYKHQHLADVSDVP